MLCIAIWKRAERPKRSPYSKRRIPSPAWPVILSSFVPYPPILESFIVKHIGLYAFRTHVLPTIQSLPASPLEESERLEQLRWLEAGLRIRVMLSDQESIGIDTPEDLKRLPL